MDDWNRTRLQKFPIGSYRLIQSRAHWTNSTEPVEGFQPSYIIKEFLLHYIVRVKEFITDIE